MEVVPALGRRKPSTGEWGEARLDVATRDSENGAIIYVDWSVTCEHNNDTNADMPGPASDGLAATQAVDKKKARDPPHGGELVPAVLESNGRPADELISRSHGQDLPDTERSAIVADWRQIQRRLAGGYAEMVLSAG